MKQLSGDEIRQAMAEMPAELVQALKDACADHDITEWEARFWGMLQVARTGAHEGDSYTFPINGGGEHTERFLDYTLSDRLSTERAGLVRRPWPDGGLTRRDGSDL